MSKVCALAIAKMIWSNVSLTSEIEKTCKNKGKKKKKKIKRKRKSAEKWQGKNIMKASLNQWMRETLIDILYWLAIYFGIEMYFGKYIIFPYPTF